MKESNFQFTDPSLVSMKFEENKHFSVEKRKETGLSVSHTKVSENEAVVELKINLGDKGEQSPFYLETILMAKFKWVSELEESKVNLFLDQNAPALLLSYARPIVSMTTNASHFAAYNIPFINFADAR